MELAPWASFAGGAITAASSLAGLLFVGVSLNLDVVLEHRHLASRAGTALATLVGVAMLNLVTPGILLTAGIVLLAGGPAGLLAAATIAGVLAAVLEAWVLIIEIRR